MVKCDICNKEATKDAKLKQGGWVGKYIAIKGNGG